MPKYSKAEVGAILRDELGARRASYMKAKEELDTVTDSLSGFPHPDGTLYLKHVGAAHTAASKAYTTAIREHSRFTTSGEIPTRFEE
jgi:hypothetical protein